MKKFTFSENHGNNKKGDSVGMHESTAKAMEAHKIGKMGGKWVPPVVEDKDEDDKK